MKKQLKQLLKTLGIPRRAVSKTRNGHYRIKVSHAFIHTSATPSCPFVAKKIKADIRRAMKGGV